MKLVIFDVDGTLYRQSPLRLRMLAEMAGHIARTHDLTVPRVIRTYRHLREVMGEQELPEFEPALLQRTAAEAGADRRQVEQIVTEWIERRPLRHLSRCAVHGAGAVFDGLRRRGKKIGVWSDYPAVQKLKSLDLTADIIISSGDTGIGRLKPHPRGIETIMSAMGVKPSETLMIGDRDDRDGAAARRVSASYLIRGDRISGHAEFTNFHDPLFEEVRSA